MTRNERNSAAEQERDVMYGKKIEMDNRTVDQMTDIEFVDWIENTVRFMNNEPPIYPQIRQLIKIEIDRYLPRLIELARKAARAEERNE
jgi:hypothetical protein